MNIEVGQVRVEDGGLDGKAAVSPAGGNDNRPFAIHRACSRRRRLTEKQVERRGPVPAPFPALVRALVGEVGLEPT